MDCSEVKLNLFNNRPYQPKRKLLTVQPRSIFQTTQLQTPLTKSLYTSKTAVLCLWIVKLLLQLSPNLRCNIHVVLVPALSNTNGSSSKLDAMIKLNTYSFYTSRHQRTHTGNHKCTHTGCQFLQRGFATSKDLRRRLDTSAHRKPLNAKIRCFYPGCRISLTRKDNLLRHCREKHP